MANPKMHELLAVEANLKTQAAATTADLMNTFEKKRILFGGKNVTFKPFISDESTGVVETREEQTEINTTVPRELRWIQNFLVKSWDMTHRVAVGNTIAKADITLEDGTVLAADVPAIHLLELEKHVGELLRFVKAIPTLDPAKGFKIDTNVAEDVYQAREVNQIRTKKTIKALVLYPHSDKHPAQVEKVSEDVPTGTVTTLEWSGLITPVQKGQIIERVEQLAQATKRARSRANEVEVPPVKLGSALIDFAFWGTTSK